MEAPLCIVNRRPLFHHIYPHFLVCLCVLNEAGTNTPISTHTVSGKAVGKWETGHSVCSPKEKLNAVFPCLWPDTERPVFKPYQRNRFHINTCSSSCAAAR